MTGTCGAAETRFLFRENLQLQTTISFYRERVTLIGREIRVAAPNFSRQYLSVSNQNIPMQADVTVKQETVAKLLCTTLRRISFVRTPSEGNLILLS